MPAALAPMHPTQVAQPFHHEGWVYEEKVDGYRVLAYKDGETVRLVSRRAKDLTARFPELAVAIARLEPENLVLDGEVGPGRFSPSRPSGAEAPQPRPGSLPFVSTDQLNPHDNSPVNSLPQVGPGVQGRQGDERVESRERKGVAVRRARRRAGPGIADNVEIVEPLTSNPRYGVLPRDALRKFAERRGDSGEQPVDRDPGGWIDIVHRQGEALRAGGGIGPSERR